MKVVLVAAVGSLLMFTACGPAIESRCGQVCETFNSCTLEQQPVDYECDEYCPIATRMTTGGQCQAQYDAFFNCRAGQPAAEICTPPETDPCGTQAADWTACLDAYCQSQIVTNDGVTTSPETMCAEVEPGVWVSQLGAI